MSDGIHTLRSMFGPLSSVQAGLKDGRWVAAVCEPFDSPLWRIRGALAVLTGRARAVAWPVAGELEDALDLKNLRPAVKDPSHV